MVDFLTEAEAQALDQIDQLARDQQLSIWVVGGIIRDILLEFPQRLADIDLVVEGQASVLASSVAQHFNASFHEFPDFHTAKVRGIPAIEILDLASARRETYPAPGVLPLVERGTFDEDALRRDFSINALYVSLGDFIRCSNSSELRPHIRDVTAGLSDLDSRVIRVLHKKSFIDDPSRLFRALRYKIRINGQLEDDTKELFSSALHLGAIKTISAQRILNEILRACDEGRWKSVIAEFCSSGLLGASGIIEAIHAESFMQIVDAADNLESAEHRFDFVMAALYLIDRHELRESRFRHFGFGKRFFSRMQKLCGSDHQDTLLKTAILRAFSINGLKCT